jgi:hypothetical protein
VDRQRRGVSESNKISRPTINGSDIANFCAQSLELPLADDRKRRKESPSLRCALHRPQLRYMHDFDVGQNGLEELSRA